MSADATPSTEAPEASRTDWQLLKRMWPFVRQHVGWLWVVAIATPLGVAAELVQPLLLKMGIDDYVLKGDVDGLWGLSAVFMGVVLLGFAIRSLGLFALQLVGLRVLNDLRRDLFRHVLSQGQRFFDKRTTGALMTRTTTDVEAVHESLTFGAVGLITDALSILGILAAMAWLDWKLTLAAFALAPIIVLVVNLARKKLRTFFTGIRVGLSRLNGTFAEQIHGMRVIQLERGGERAREKFRGQAWEYLDLYRRANWWDAGLYAVMDGMSALAVGLMLLYAAHQFGVEADAPSLGLLVAFIDYLHKIFVPIREFSGRLAIIQRAVAALERIFSLRDTDERIGGGHERGEPARGNVRFDDVTFGYQPDRPAVLRGVSLEIAPGEVVALVGATGSGKSTVGKLLLRAYDGYAGSITLDGRELRDLALEDVRRDVVAVHQDPYLFAASIHDNIALWSPDIDEAGVREASRRARAQGFIEALSDGYAHVCAERGGNLSAGQRQLISIARAMARPAPVVILDEATAAVDSLTEALIDEAVAELFSARTVLVIAHRLSTIAKADRVVVLHEGRVVESGTHEALLAAGGRYAVLVDSGFEI